MTHQLTTTKNQSLQKHDLMPRIEIPVELSPELGQVELEIVRANRCFPKASQCKKEVFVSELNNLITKTYKDAGFKFKSGDLADITFTVAEDIYREFPTITIPELEIAFRKGSRKEYGDELMGLSAIVFYGFIRSYYWQTRAEATIKQRKFEEEQEQKAKEWKPTPDEEKVIQFFAIRSILKAYYAKESFTLDSGDYTFNALKKINVLPQNPTPEYHQQIYLQAQKKIKKRMDEEINQSKSVSSKNHIRKELNNIIYPANSESGNKSIIAEAKIIHVTNCLAEHCKGKKEDEIASAIRHKLLGHLTGDELIWEAWRLKLKKPKELFKTEKAHKDFLVRTERLRQQKPMRP